MTDEIFYTRLKNRGMLRVGGQDARDFLQGLVTNDVRALDDAPCIYACLLSPQGKFLHDFFITCEAQSGDFLLDCEGGERALDLAKRLRMYKLRSDVTLDVAEEQPVFAVFGTEIGVKDPRHEEMGYRSFEEPEALEERGFEVWDERRVRLCIPDGARDLAVGKSTMDEARMDQLNAVSYDKGCYVGQELTARMHYRGLGKKHLQVVDVDALPDGAELRSSCGSIGLALVRD